MANSVSDECSAVAFYGLTLEPSAFDRLFQKLVDWCESIDCPPNRLGIEGDSFDGKVRSFRHNSLHLRTVGFSRVQGISLYSLPPDGKTPVTDWRVSAHVNVRWNYCAIGVLASVVAFEDLALFPITQVVIDESNPLYGVGYQRSLALGPTLYAIGLCQGIQPWGIQDQEARRISKWMHGFQDRVYQNGLLRDVFRWNFLTDVHLSVSVGGISLFEWIQADEARGSLSKVSRRMYRWQLTEEQIEQIRPILAENGLIYGYRP